LIARPLHNAKRSLRNAARAALLLPFVLVGCSSLALQPEDAPAAGPDPGYLKAIAKRMQSTFTDLGSYTGFEISDFRWVHSARGWTWLTCIRFDDAGHRRWYAMFLKDNDIIYSRFAVEADACDVQNYTPFDLTGASRPASPGNLTPLH